MSHLNTKPYNAFIDADNRLTIEVGVAGFDEGEVKVERIGQHFFVTGEKLDTPVEVKQFFNRGLSYRKFKDSYIVPYEWKLQTAELINGVLRIRFSEEKETIPVIRVQSAKAIADKSCAKAQKSAEVTCAPMQ